MDFKKFWTWMIFKWENSWSIFWLENLQANLLKFLRDSMAEYNKMDDFWAFMAMHPFIWIALFSVVVFMCVAMMGAMITLEERKLIAAMQLSSGPSSTAFFGMAQPLADAFKMILKEFIDVSNVKTFLFSHSAPASFFAASFFWLLMPANGDFTLLNTNYSTLYLMIMSLMHAYCVLMAGWSSNSKYGFLGAMSTVCQLVSYDMTVMFSFMQMYMVTSSLDFFVMAKDQYLTGANMRFTFLMYSSMLLSQLAETSSHPFDLPEAEAELVAGYNVEYSSMSFGMFFLAEYASVGYNAALTNMLFLNPDFTYGFDFIFELLKMTLMAYVFMALSSLIPSYSYDQLMSSCWKGQMPIICASFVLNVSLLIIM